MWRLQRELAAAQRLRSPANVSAHTPDAPSQRHREALRGKRTRRNRVSRVRSMGHQHPQYSQDPYRDLLHHIPRPPLAWVPLHNQGHWYQRHTPRPHIPHPPLSRVLHPNRGHWYQRHLTWPLLSPDSPQPWQPPYNRGQLQRLRHRVYMPQIHYPPIVRARQSPSRGMTMATANLRTEKFDKNVYSTRTVSSSETPRSNMWIGSVPVKTSPMAGKETLKWNTSSHTTELMTSVMVDNVIMWLAIWLTYLENFNHCSPKQNWIIQKCCMWAERSQTHTYTIQ